MLEFCEFEKITFTRSRAYRSNDQAHVEEKNGSIVRRLVGYDRYEGVAAWHKLTELYNIIRLYINFFQPSLKLCSKERLGAKIIKKYEKAQTPYQRLINSSHLSEENKLALMGKYKTLDPVSLLEALQQKQEEFWKHAWTEPDKLQKGVNDVNNVIIDASSASTETLNAVTNFKNNTNLISLEYYKKSRKTRKIVEFRTWRTRKDPFEKVWCSLLTQLKLNPELTAKSLLETLIKKHPTEFNMDQLRTLQRRVSGLRKDQLQLEKEYQIKLMTSFETTAHDGN